MIIKNDVIWLVSASQGNTILGSELCMYEEILPPLDSVGRISG